MKKFVIPLAALAPIVWTFNDAFAYGETPEIVPEPSTWLLLGSGLAGLAAWRWYNSEQKK